MQSLLENIPEFYEVYFFLGDMNLNLGKSLTAEKMLLKAYEPIPSSVSVLSGLTKIHFFLEEYESSLEFNEKILALVPGYRDSLLGKAVCLGYLGRHDEAIKILEHLIELGMFLMGESHYWLAWNQRELGQLEEAWENIKRASNYLIGHYEVHSLSGLIAFDRGDFDSSEDELKRALWLNDGDCEANFTMGKIYGQRNDWAQSGNYFEKAAVCNAGLEKAVEAKIKEFQTSTLSEPRKERAIARKTVQLRKIRVTKATAYYNAAAVFFNDGQDEKALELAKNAIDSKTLLPKVQELINKIIEKRGQIRE